MHDRVEAGSQIELANEVARGEGAHVQASFAVTCLNGKMFEAQSGKHSFAVVGSFVPVDAVGRRLIICNV